jgi:hypothetical protein
MDAIANQVIGDPLERTVFDCRHKRLIQLCLRIAEMEKNLALALETTLLADLRQQQSLM